MKRLASFVAMVLLTASCGQAAPAAKPRQISADEAAATAREHLSWFRDRLTTADPADAKFSLTVRMPGEGKRKSPELTMRDIAIEGDYLLGTVVKADEAWPEYAEGNRFRFPGDVVSDWSFAHDGRLIGAFWLRAQMCNLGQMLTVVGGRTLEAEATVSDLREQLDPAESCEPYDPREDYADR